MLTIAMTHDQTTLINTGSYSNNRLSQLGNYIFIIHKVYTSNLYLYVTCCSHNPIALLV